MRVEIELENTSIRISCASAEELYKLYWNLGHDFVFIINGTKLEQAGPREHNGYFGGYTRAYFKKFFNEEQ